MYMLNMVIILIVMYCNVVTAIDKIPTYLLRFNITIPIYLVSSTTDSIRWLVVLFKSVTIPTSDPKSEFLCQSSLSCAEPTDPLNSPRTPGISPTPSQPRIILIAIARVLLPSI